METSKLRKRMPVSTLFDLKIVAPAISQAFVKLNPGTLIKNPVIFVLEVVTVLTTVLFVRDMIQHHAGLGFTFQIIVWLWFTVLFANFAEAVAEGRGRAPRGCSAKSCFPQGSSWPSAENRSGRLRSQCLAKPFSLAIRSPRKRADLSHHHRVPA